MSKDTPYQSRQPQVGAMQNTKSMTIFPWLDKLDELPYERILNTIMHTIILILKKDMDNQMESESTPKVYEAK
jgi:hypothetical protein